MTSISSPSMYYQLSSLQNSTSSSTSGGGKGNAATSPTEMLLNALQEADGNSSQKDNTDAFSLNLSPAAQMLMNNSDNQTSSSSTAGTSFTLTKAQQADIQAILEKYKDAPATQDTFNAIQNDLEAAKLGPDQLSAQDQITSFNTLSSLLNYLNGDFNTVNSAATTLSNQQDKANNYMQSVMTLWQSISSGSPDGSPSDSTTA